MSTSRYWISTLLFYACASTASQDGLTQLQQFVSKTQSAQGTFEQSASATPGRRAQDSSGTFAFERPSKFRWTYEKPYKQVLVADGKRLWTYDPELNQVAVKKIDTALGSTPAAILAGSGTLEKHFTLSEEGESEGLSWVGAVPKNKDSGFESLRLGLAQGQLRRMEMKDSFGQTSSIIFNQIQANTKIELTKFQFSPPPGADVLEAP